MDKFKEVTHDDFEKFLAEYPRKLERHLTTICDPEMLGFYDFSLGKSAEDALVAKKFCFDPNDPRGGFEPTYYVSR